MSIFTRKCFAALMTSTLLLVMGQPAHAALSFYLRESFPVPAGFYHVVDIADLDGDTALDLVLWGGTSYMVLEREQDGSWAERFTYGQSPCRSVNVADVDGDARLEILSADYTSVAIHEARADDSYELIHQSSGYGTKIENVKVGDSNGNGNLEFLIAREGIPSRVTILEGTADNAYTDLGSLTGTGGDCWLAGARDLDADGQPETVFHDSERFSATPGYTYVCQGGSAVSKYPDFGAIELGDTDGNGRLEMIGATMITQYIEDLVIRENDGDNSFREVLSLPGWWTSLSQLGACDVNEDGRIELLRRLDEGEARNVLSIATRAGHQMEEIFNSGTLFQDDNVDITSARAVGDTNGDGYPELAVLQGERLHILEVVPEPSSLVLLGFGAVGLLARVWRKRRRGRAVAGRATMFHFRRRIAHQGKWRVKRTAASGRLDNRRAAIWPPQAHPGRME